MKVGDYVRTKDGKIEKYSGTNDSEIENFALNEIIKSSPNIMDLIEVGDYVNGMRVKDINDVAGFVIVNTSAISENTIFSYNIKSIVTKEQFESMEYKVGE